MALVSRPRATPAFRIAVCVTTDAVGDLVYVRPQVGGQFAVEKVDITAAAKMPSVGAIISKATATSCVVQVSGTVRGVYTGLTAGAVHYAGLDSQPTDTVPTPTGGDPRVYVQPVGVAEATDELFLQPYPHAIVRIL